MPTAKYRCEMNFDLINKGGNFEFVPHKTTGSQTIRLTDEAYAMNQHDLANHKSDPERVKKPCVDFKCSHCNGSHRVPFESLSFA